jgi:hypothetical protein
VNQEGACSSARSPARSLGRRKTGSSVEDALVDNLARRDEPRVECAVDVPAVLGVPPEQTLAQFKERLAGGVSRRDDVL